MTTKRFAVIIFVRKDTHQVLISETIPLVKRNRCWVCPSDKLKLVHLGLQRVDGEQGKVVEFGINEPRFYAATDYFVFVAQTEAEADVFAAGALVYQAASVIKPLAALYDCAFNLN